MFSPKASVRALEKSGGRFHILSLFILSGEKNMPTVNIQWFEGRDIETKKRTLELVTKAICEGCGTKPENVTVIFTDIKKSNWGRNGKLREE